MKLFALLFLLLPFALISQDWKENDRVQVASDGKIFQGIILEVQEGGYLISYDGYASSYDEVVKKEKISPMKEIPGAKYMKQAAGNKEIVIKGSLSSGKRIKDLSWAERSDIACWPGIRDIEFKGHHVFYWFDLPKRSIARVTVTPKNGKRINLYGYSFDGKSLPPLKYGVQTCEASHPQWIGKPDFTKPAEPQSIDFNTTTRRNAFMIGVAGAEGVLDGEFDLRIEIKD